MHSACMHWVCLQELYVLHERACPYVYVQVTTGRFKCLEELWEDVRGGLSADHFDPRRTPRY